MTPARGQAAIETAFTIPVLVIIVLFTVGLSILTTARAETSAAVSLAALGAVTAPAHRGDIGMAYANAAWNGTMRHYPYLDPSPLPRSCAGNPDGSGYAPGDRVTCTGTVKILLSHTPAGALWLLPDPVISVSVTVSTSTFRASCPTTVCPSR